MPMPDKDVIQGLIKQVEGRVQEVVGDVTCNLDLMAKGEVNERAGKEQEAAGHRKDAARSADRISRTRD